MLLITLGPGDSEWNTDTSDLFGFHGSDPMVHSDDSSQGIGLPGWNQA